MWTSLEDLLFSAALFAGGLAVATSAIFFARATSSVKTGGRP